MDDYFITATIASSCLLSCAHRVRFACFSCVPHMRQKVHKYVHKVYVHSLRMLRAFAFDQSWVLCAFHRSENGFTS